MNTQLPTPLSRERQTRGAAAGTTHIRTRTSTSKPRRADRGPWIKFIEQGYVCRGSAAMKTIDRSTASTAPPARRRAGTGLAGACRGPERRELPGGHPPLARHRGRCGRGRVGAANDQVSRLHMSRTFEGWLRVDGLLAPDDADVVEAALGAGVDRALRAAHDGDPSVAGRPLPALRAGRAGRPRCPGHAAGTLRCLPSRTATACAVLVQSRPADRPRRGGLRRRCLPGRPRRRG